MRRPLARTRVWKRVALSLQVKMSEAMLFLAPAETSSLLVTEGKACCGNGEAEDAEAGKRGFSNVGYRVSSDMV